MKHRKNRTLSRVILAFFCAAFIISMFSCSGEKTVTIRAQSYMIDASTDVFAAPSGTEDWIQTECSADKEENFVWTLKFKTEDPKKSYDIKLVYPDGSFNIIKDIEPKGNEIVSLSNKS